MEGNKKIVIHQVLNGYSEGHGLLASSCELNSEEKRLINELSDLPGSFSDMEFNSYLTGYPIPNSSYYALARTWHASEMKRPGCVWTHTLLISLSTLGRLNKLHFLNSLFKRPKLDSYSVYNKPIEINSLVEYPNSDNYLDHSTELDLLTYLLYEESEKPIIFNPQGKSDLEVVLYKLWNQQWPRLRRSFTFCSNVSTPRYLQGKIFDLQFTTAPSTRFVDTRTKTELLYVTSSYDNSLKKEWFSLYKVSNLKDLLVFMYRYGSDVKGLRKNYVPLFYSYQLLINDELSDIQLPHILNFFQKYFPEKDEAKTLKNEIIEKLFGADSRQTYYFILSILENHSEASRLFEINLDFLEIIQSLWENQAISKIELSTILDTLNKDLIKDIPNFLLALPIDAWINKKWVTAKIIDEILTIKPEISTSKEIWSSNQTIQKTWFSVIFSRQKRFKDTSLMGIVETMLDLGNQLFVKELEKLHKEKLILSCVNFIKKTERKLPGDWEEIVLKSPKKAIESLKVVANQQVGIEIISKIISSGAEDIDEIESKIWVEIIDGSKRFEFDGTRQILLVNILATCLSNKLSDSEIICSHVFHIIHTEAAKGNIENHLWRSILSSIPKTKTVQVQSSGLLSRLLGLSDEVASWDRCEILRRGIVESYVAFAWDLRYFIPTISSIETFEMIIKFCSKSKAGRAFVKDLKKVSNTEQNKEFMKVIKNSKHL